jgi:predicted nuclease of restriction endonuclease-like (RecB) superfamily
MADKLSLMDGYDEFLRELKERIRSAQIKAALSVNRELVLLYWQIGREIITRQQQQGWGAKVIERLAKDLKAAFPEMKGFSARNLKYMRAFIRAAIVKHTTVSGKTPEDLNTAVGKIV